MKKFIYLLVFTIATGLFISCNKDNDSPDPLVGKWELIQSFDNGEESQIECYDYVIVEFKADGTYWVEYFDYDANNNCNSQGVSEIGSWKNQNTNVYIIFDGNYSIEMKIEFIDNTITVSYADGNYTYKDVFIRL